MATAGPSAPTAPVPPPAPDPLEGSLRLVGASRADQVRVRDFSADGFTKVRGNIEADTATIRGSLAAGGRLTARQLRCSGSHRIDGEVQVAQTLEARGTLRVGAALSASSAMLRGSVSVGTSLTVADRLRWTGSLEAGQDVRASQVSFRGRMAIRGTLYARTIVGEVDALSTVGAIEADWIEIRRKKSLRDLPLFLLPPPPWSELEVERIEAGEVHLAGVRVRRLVSDRVWLGPDAHVEYVEGTIVSQHKDAHVGPESESPPPPGLSR